jgi:dihydropteroate synthase type 2
MVRTFGIVNVTRDSFSDGGRYFDPQAAIVHGEQLLAAGADVLDIGAESTHPDAERVDAAEELRRLHGVVPALLAVGARISIDTCKPTVMRAMTGLGVHWLNDVDGFRQPESLAAAAAAPAHVRFVVMFQRGAGPRAARPELGTDGLLAAIEAFAVERVRAFAAVGVARSRLVFDPGMGFFLGRTAAPSLHVLRHLGRLRGNLGELLVSVSRKSFVGEIAGRPPAERGPATLAAELWAARAGVDWIRTHDVEALRAAWAVEAAIGASS